MSIPDQMSIPNQMSIPDQMPNPNLMPKPRQHVNIIDHNSIISNYTYILLVLPISRSNIHQQDKQIQDKQIQDYGKYFPVVNYPKSEKIKGPFDQKMVLYDINKKIIINTNYSEISKIFPYPPLNICPFGICGTIYGHIPMYYPVLLAKSIGEFNQYIDLLNGV